METRLTMLNCAGKFRFMLPADIIQIQDENYKVYRYTLKPDEIVFVRPITQAIDGDGTGFGTISVGSEFIIKSPHGDRVLQLSEMQHIPQELFERDELERKRETIRRAIRELHEAPSAICGRHSIY